MHYPISSGSLRRVKSIGRQLHPEIKSTHLSEILAAGLGYRTHAALNVAISNQPVYLEWSDERANRRADAISSPHLDPGILRRPEILNLGVLKHLDAWSIERVCDIATRAALEQDELLPRSGKLSAMMARINELTEKGVWPTSLHTELQTTVRSLLAPQLFELQAVMWLERERYSDSQWRWSRLVEHAENTHNDDSYAYVLSKGSLGQYLWIGLQMMTERFLASNA